MILLTTLNARYSHCALGLRYLLANMGELGAQTQILEFVISDRPEDVVEKLLAEQPKIIGFAVYIWNVEVSEKVIALLRQIAPEVIVVLGGPEISYEADQQTIVRWADHVIQGPGDLAFPALCRQLLAGKSAEKLIKVDTVPLDTIQLPYAYYTDADIAHRVLYVEASRGCPFKCEFCLSALDKTAWPFPLEPFLHAMDVLYRRGARQFKFVDRTFNLNIKTSAQILEFFLDRLDEPLFLHFELIPDHLPDALKSLIARFPPGTLQFEVGIQSFNPQVQGLISRKQDNDKAEANLRWLAEHSSAHVHTDLIVGLPGEDEASFAQGFDRLVAMGVEEIQVGLLKRLRGAPIARHTVDHGMRYSPHAPYNLLTSDRLDFTTVQRMTRFARYWDLVGNSGRFRRSTGLLLGNSPYAHFMAFSQWLLEHCRRTHQIALNDLYDYVHQWLVLSGIDPSTALHALAADFGASGSRSIPAFLQAQINRNRHGLTKKSPSGTPHRQSRHLQASADD